MGISAVYTVRQTYFPLVPIVLQLAIGTLAIFYWSSWFSQGCGVNVSRQPALSVPLETMFMYVCIYVCIHYIFILIYHLYNLYM